MTDSDKKSRRGFASMSAEQRQEIASKGGKAAHAKGTAHEFDSGEGRAAGHLGGMAVSRDREHMAEIGRRGGKHRAERLAAGEIQAPRRKSRETVGTNGGTFGV